MSRSSGCGVVICGARGAVVAARAGDEGDAEGGPGRWRGVQRPAAIEKSTSDGLLLQLALRGHGVADGVGDARPSTVHVSVLGRDGSTRRMLPGVPSVTMIEELSAEAPWSTRVSVALNVVAVGRDAAEVEDGARGGGEDRDRRRWCCLVGGVMFTAGARAVPAGPHRGPGGELSRSRPGGARRRPPTPRPCRPPGLVGLIHRRGGWLRAPANATAEATAAARAGVARPVALRRTCTVGTGWASGQGRRPRRARPGGGLASGVAVPDAAPAVDLHRDLRGVASAVPAAPLKVGVASLVVAPLAGAVRVTVGGNLRWSRTSCRSSVLDAVNVACEPAPQRCPPGRRPAGRRSGSCRCGRPSAAESRHSPASALRAMSSAGRPMTSSAPASR